MKLTLGPYVLAILCNSALALEPTPAVPSASTGQGSMADEHILETGTPVLELRQIPAGGGGVGAPVTTPDTQPDAVTVQWLLTHLPDGGTTYVPFTYTQTFASVPDQWPAPFSGEIGYGTLKDKRDVVPTQAVAATGVAGRIRR